MNPFDLTPASIPFVHASDKAAMLQSVIPLAVAKGVASNADTLSATDIAIAAREPLRNANPNPDASYILTLTRYYKLMRPIAEHANDHDVLRATVANPSKWVSENVSLECSSIAGEAVAAAINLAAAKIFSGIGNHYDATRFFSEAEAILQEAATLAESGHLCGFLGPTHLRALALFAQAQSLESTAVSKINKLGAEEIESTELQTALRTLTEASALYDRVFKDLAPTASSSTVVASTSLFKAKLLPALARYVVANAYFNGNRLSNTATECRRASELLTVAQAALELTPDQERMTSELATAIIGIQSNLPVAGVDDEAQLYDLQRMTEQDFREFKQAYGAPTDVLPPWRNDSSQDTAALNELRRIVASKDDEIQALNISLRNAQLELLQVSSGSVLNTEVTYLKGLLEKEHETVKSLQEAAELKNKEVDALNEALKQQEEMVKSLCESISPSASRKNLKSPAAGDASTREADRRERMIKKLQMQVMSKDIEINELKSSLELANSGMLASTTGATTDEVDALRRDIAALQNAIDDKDKEVKRLEDEIRQKDDTMIELRGRTESEIESLQETAASKDQEIAKLEAELKSTLQMIQALKNSEADGAGATNILQREKAHLEDKLQEKENIVAELNEALRKKDLTIAELHESAAAQQRKEQETIDFYENLKREQNQVISDLRSSLSAKQATLAMAEETAKTLESEVQSLKSEVDAKTMEIESLLAMSTSKANDMDQTMEELQSLRTELLAKEGEIQTLRNLIEEKEAIISDLRMAESEHQNKYTTLQTTLQRLNEDLQSRDRQIVALLEEAEATAERQKASQHLQEQLQRQISQQDIVSKSVQEQVCMMSDAACRARYLEDKLATKTYDEEVLRTMIQRVEDADRDKGRTIESLRTEIEFLRSEPKYQPDDRSGQIEALEDKIVALNTHIRYLTNELLQKEQELVRLANDDKSAETDRLKKLLISQDDELNELKENLFLLREKGISDGILDGEPTMVPASMLVSKQEEIDRLKEALESLSAEEPIIVTRHEEPEEDISSLKKQLTELTGLVASQAVQIEGLNAQLADKTRDLDTALYDVAVLRRALRVLEDDYRDSERNLDQLEQQAVNMKDAYELSLAAQVSPIGVLENELRALSTHNQQLIDVIDEKDGEISRLHASVIDAISASQVVVAPPDFSNLLTGKDAELERLRTLLDHPPVEQPADDSQKYRDAIGFLKEELAYKDHEIRRMRADSAPSEVAQIVDASLKQALAQKEEEVARLKSALEDLASDHIGQKTGEPDTAALKALQQEISTKDDEIQKLTAVIAAIAAHP
ncbi:Chromosome segregation protein SMC [Giardia duodenalis]|uniref:Chromosome segregation protein SMC n=1 Tax=Giardia intestinalis TaxID=5741 RepID=V6T7Z8_GIAIN|nr:Chromosome segregation protein SMC [Giardia intestinalis]